MNFTEGLRALADFLDAHPELKEPFGVTVLSMAENIDKLRLGARALGQCDKVFNGEWFSVEKMFGPIKFEIYSRRELVCERIVVGKREVPAHEEEIVEWTCSNDPLLKVRA